MPHGPLPPTPSLKGRGSILFQSSHYLDANGAKPLAFHHASGTIEPCGKPCWASFGRLVTFQPPPSAFTSRMLASIRRRSISTSLRWFISATVCAVMT